MGAFSGTLGSNEIFASIYNMIISQNVYADNIAGTFSGLVDAAREEGGLYGDRKLYYAADILQSYAWANDAEAGNLLSLDRPASPKCQEIVINIFRQIRLTVDNYLSKRAWANEYAFSQFNSVIQAQINDTKKVYDSTTYNSYIGTVKSPVTGTLENLEWDVTTAVGTATGEEKNRLEASFIAVEIAKLCNRLQDISRDYNDYKFLRSYNLSDLQFIWNADAVAIIEKRDLPTIYHKDIIAKLGEHVLPARYFGTVNTAETTGNGSTVRSLIEQKIGSNHYFAGDLIASTDKAPAGTSYTQNSNILFKVCHKNSVPYMSGFEVATSFFNPRSLTTTNYLTFGHNTLEYKKNYPMIVVTKK